MKKILIVGSAGAGKSTLASRLSAILALPVIHLDALFWKPAWVSTPQAEWDAVVAELAARPEWIMDGNFGRTISVRMTACDTVIFLNISRWLCLWRVVRRRIQYHRATRSDMGPDCPEQLDLEFMKWIWTFPRKEAPQILAMIKEAKSTKKVFVLRSSHEIENFLNSLE